MVTGRIFPVALTDYIGLLYMLLRSGKSMPIIENQPTQQYTCSIRPTKRAGPNALYMHSV